MIHDLIRLLVIFGLACAAQAHEVARDVTVQMFFKPEGATLRIPVRVPLRAVRDFEFPVQSGGYLDVEQLAPQMANAAVLWLANFIDVEEEGRALPKGRVAAARLSIESDRSFASFDEAIAHFAAAPLRNEDKVFWNQVYLDALLEYPIASDRASFAIHPRLERLAERVVTVLRFLPPGGAVRAYEFTGDPGMVPLDPRWHQAALRFVGMGFSHILDGVDHLLFLACLVIPFRKLRPLVWIVTAFTVAHSITLIASALNFAPDALWFPPLIETLIAASIVYMALENILGVDGRHRWMMTFGFGLVHGFGFSFALRETLQFAGGHLLTSLVAFNIGVELGQLLVLAILVPALTLFFRHVVAERPGTIILSAFIAHTGWHWLTERWQVLMQYRFEWPSAATGMRWLMWMLIFAAAASALQRWGGNADRRYTEPDRREPNTGLPDKRRIAIW